ncbi:MAG: M23 family metallopeptidase [Bdellovibrionota bacterium]
MNLKTLFLVVSLLYISACTTSNHASSSGEENLNQQSYSNDNLTSPPKTFTFDWPVNEARLTRGFLPNKRRPHLGLDLAAPKGTKILASHDGMVIYAGRAFKGFGKMILLESGYGWATIYGHLDKISVREGQLLKQGQVLGLMGRTGRSTGVHLHFEIRRNKGPVDPLPLLPNSEKVAQKVAKK